VRLNGKREIMRYLGRKNEDNSRAWQLIKLRYGRIIYLLDRKQHYPRYWTMTEWINQVDLETGHSVYDAGYDKLAADATSQTWKEREAKGLTKKREIVAV